jgi:hypothetical protein
MCFCSPIDLVTIGERQETLEYWIGPTSDSSDGDPEQETHQGGCGSMNTADDGLEIGMGRAQDVVWALLLIW